MKLFFFLIIVNFSYPFDSFTYSNQTIREIAYGKTWHKLIHYKKKGGGFESFVDGKDFFLAKDGKNNPVSELLATLSALSDSKRKIGREKQHPQCAFPLRYRFLKKQLGLSIPSVSCKKLDNFMKKFDTDEIYMVFSSAYPNNPASMFGHTLLRIRSSQRESFMLDHGINYAAFIPPDSGGFIFAVRGIFGGYRGFFSLLPYYAKINEYNNAENRDIWEFRLNLTSKEVREILFHIWELETNGYFDYYFFDENCSFHLLSLLEVVRPDLNLSDYLLYMTPADSIKKIMSIPHLVKNTAFRPSSLRKFKKSYSNLYEKQQRVMHEILDGSSMTSDSEVLDTAIMFLNYRKQMKDFKQTDEKMLNKFLSKRSKLPTKKIKPIKYHATNRPDLGHDSHMFEFDIGLLENQNEFMQFGYQTAYHDLLANDLGYEPFSEILFPSIFFRWQNSKLFLEKMNFFSITSLTPWNWFNQKFSWALKFHLFRNRYSSRCLIESCLTGNFYTGTGLTTHILSKKVIASAMILANMESGRGSAKNYAIGPAMSFLLLTNPVTWYKNNISYQYFYDLNNSGIKRRTLEWGHGISIERNTELRFILSEIKENQSFLQIKIGFLYYFM